MREKGSKTAYSWLTDRVRDHAGIRGSAVKSAIRAPINGTSAIDPVATQRSHLIEQGGCPWCTIEMFRSTLRQIRGAAFPDEQGIVDLGSIIDLVDSAFNACSDAVYARRERGQEGTYLLRHDRASGT